MRGFYDYIWTNVARINLEYIIKNLALNESAPHIKINLNASILFMSK